ncbi:hypothetical protein Tco_1404895 [Tanacetum coccineum]
MANLEFYDTHNMVAYLKKPEGSEEFHEIVDFLNASHIRYALTKNPTIYVSLIKQFWETATTRTLDNGDFELTATIDGKVKIFTEASVRRHLQLADSYEPMADETENVESVPTHSNDPLLSDLNRDQAAETQGCYKLLLPTTPTAVTKTQANGGCSYQAKRPRKLQAGNRKEERLERQKEEDANIAEWDNVQAMIDADYELAARLQAQEQEVLTIEERSKMFVELMDKRKKHFARVRAEEHRRKPPTKAQKRSQISTYLKHMAGYKQNQLKSKNYDEIHKLFDKAMTRVNMFVGMDTELVKESTQEGIAV